ncbi:hypothetical protein [Comamonas testosteroni]
MINVAGTPISTTPAKTGVIDCYVFESLQEVHSMTMADCVATATIAHMNR